MKKIPLILNIITGCVLAYFQYLNTAISQEISTISGIDFALTKDELACSQIKYKTKLIENQILEKIKELLNTTNAKGWLVFVV